MRLSLSVPDALWLLACEACPLLSPSRLVQTALERLVSGALTGYRQGPPAGAGERLGRIALRLRDEARAAHEEGYRAGLELAEALDWWALERLAAADWRLEGLGRSGGAGAVLDELRWRLAASERPAARALATELERRPAGDVRRVATFTGGLMAALRDCASGP